MNSCLRSISIFLGLASLTLSGCMAGVANGKRTDGVNEISCTAAKSEFETTGSVQPSLLLTQLPVGIYRHASSEVFFENIVEENPTDRMTRVQFLVTPVAGRNVPTYTSSMRCRETVGREESFSADAVVMSDFSISTARLYTFDTLTYNLDFNPTAAASLNVFNGGGLPNSSAADVMSMINRTWNASYFFARRAGNTYELHGVRIIGNQKMLVKAVYTRFDR